MDNSPDKKENCKKRKCPWDIPTKFTPIKLLATSVRNPPPATTSDQNPPPATTSDRNPPPSTSKKPHKTNFHFPAIYATKINDHQIEKIKNVSRAIINVKAGDYTLDDQVTLRLSGTDLQIKTAIEMLQFLVKKAEKEDEPSTSHFKCQQ